MKSTEMIEVQCGECKKMVNADGCKYCYIEPGSNGQSRYSGEVHSGWAARVSQPDGSIIGPAQTHCCHDCFAKGWKDAESRGYVEGYR